MPDFVNAAACEGEGGKKGARAAARRGSKKGSKKGSKQVPPRVLVPPAGAAKRCGGYAGVPVSGSAGRTSSAGETPL
jgi:hypothetical protein